MRQIPYSIDNTIDSDSLTLLFRRPVSHFILPELLARGPVILHAMAVHSSSVSYIL